MPAGWSGHAGRAVCTERTFLRNELRQQRAPPGLQGQSPRAEQGTGSEAAERAKGPGAEAGLGTCPKAAAACGQGGVHFSGVSGTVEGSNGDPWRASPDGQRAPGTGGSCSHIPVSSRPVCDQTSLSTPGSLDPADPSGLQRVTPGGPGLGWQSRELAGSGSLCSGCGLGVTRGSRPGFPVPGLWPRLALTLPAGDDSRAAWEEAEQPRQGWASQRAGKAG